MPIQLPSASFLLRKATDTMRRFPFELLFALIGTISAVSLVNNAVYGLISDGWYQRLFMMGAIGLPLSLATTLFLQDKALTPFSKLVAKCLVAAIALALLFVLNPAIYPQHTVQFMLILLAAHLLISFAKFTGTGDAIAFWEFNRALLNRTIIGLLYSLVFALGLTAAFSAVNSLFGFNFYWDNIYKIWIIALGLINTFFVLAGLPGHLQPSPIEFTYPKGLKIFSQYVLIPLATIYLIILLAYEIKILIDWELPKGTVSALILGYAGIGLLALVLVYPIREEKGSGWVKVYSKYFYLFLLPLIVLLILAVSTRINNYGITQYRFFLIALAVWLTFLIIYFLSYKKATIKAIPVSLFVIIVLITYGPLSATGITLRSQKAVLLNLFLREASVKNNKLVPVEEKNIKPYYAVRMASTLTYLLNHYNFEALQPLFSINLAHKQDSIRKSYIKDGNYYLADDNYGFKWAENSWLQGYLGLSGYDNQQYDKADMMENSLFANYYVKCGETISSVKGYDYMLNNETYVDTIRTDTVASYIIKLKEDYEQSNMIISIGTSIFKFSTKSLAQQIIKQAEIIKPYQDKATSQGLNKSYFLPQKMLQLTQQNNKFKVTMRIQELSFDDSKKEGVRVSTARAYYLIAFK